MGIKNWQDGSNPYTTAVAKTVGDPTFAEARGFRVSGAGTLTVLDSTGATVVFPAIEAGWHPLAITRFISGTATGLMACY